METVHRLNDYDREFKEKFVYNSKYMFKLIIYLLLLTDYLWNSIEFIVLRVFKLEFYIFIFTICFRFLRLGSLDISDRVYFFI